MVRILDFESRLTLDVDLFTVVEYRSADSLHSPTNSLVLKRLGSSFSRRVNRPLPAEVWIGSEKLSLADFAATLAADDGARNSPAVGVIKPVTSEDMLR